MTRRELLLMLGGALVVPRTLPAQPRTLPAQQKATAVIGYLGSASAEAFAPMVAAFRQGLKEAGYVEGHNVAIEFARVNTTSCRQWPTNLYAGKLL